MSETRYNPFPEVEEERGSPGLANLVYVFNLVGLVAPVFYLVSLVIAYVSRDEAAPWLKTHYRHQILIFWKGLLYTLLAIALTPILIGFIIGFLALLWWIIRNVKGLQYLGRGEAYPTPETWGLD